MGRMEILGRERRRNWSDEEKLRFLAAAEEQGVSLAEVARRHDLFPQQLYAWRRMFREAAAVASDGEPVRFLTVELETPQTSELQSRPRRRREKPVEVALANGRRLKVDPGIEPEVLLRLVRALERA